MFINPPPNGRYFAPFLKLLQSKAFRSFLHSESDIVFPLFAKQLDLGQIRREASVNSNFKYLAQISIYIELLYFD